MAPKRKHVASPTAPTPEAGPSAKKSRAGLNAQSTNPTADDDNDNNHSYKVEAEWELVGTDRKYTRFIGNKSLNAVVPIVADRLGASMVGLQIMHVRQGGMESPVWDDYDFKAIRNRAEATGSKKETLRVYSAAIGQHPTPPSSLAGSAPPSVDRGMARDTLSVPAPRHPPTSAPTPRSALRTPGTSDTPRTQKRVLIALPTDSPPSTPSPAFADHISPGQYSASPNFQLGQQPVSSQGKTTNNRNRKKRRKRKSIESTEEEEEEEEVPPPSRSPRFSVSSPVTSASSTFVLGPVPTPSEAHTHAPPTSLRPSTISVAPSAPNDKETTSASAATPAAPPTIAKVQQYKPSRPSPLSQTEASPSATAAAAAADERPKKKGRVSDAAPVVKAVAKSTDNLPPLVGGLPPVVGAVEPAPAPAPAPAPVAIPVPGASTAAQPAPSAIPVAGASAAKKKKKGQEVAATDQEPKSAEPAEVPVPKVKKIRARRSAGRKSLDGEISTSETAPQQPQPQAEAAPSAPTAKSKPAASSTTTKAAPPATPLTREDVIASVMAGINASLAKHSPAPLAPTPTADSSKTPAPQTPAPEHATPTPKSKLKGKDKPVKEMSAKGTKTETTTQRMLKELHKKRATAEPELPWDPREPFATAPEPTSGTPQPSSTALELSSDGPAHSTAVTELESSEQSTPTAKKRPRKSDVTTPIANGTSNGTPGSAKSVTATPKSAAAPPTTPCVICGELDTHIQKDCSAVAAGVEKLKERLEVRRADLVQLRKEGKNRSQSDLKELDEASDYGCQAIKSWIQRLTNITAKVNGTESPAKSVAAATQSPTTGAAKAPVPVTPATTEEPIVIDDDEDDEEDEDENADGTSSAASSRASSPNSSAASTPVVVAPETPFYPATIHLKALARPRRPGSMSGLSVSDAVIETGDSGSESEESGSENESESISGASSDNSSSDDEDVDPAELMRRVMNKPLSSRQRQRARLSAASMHHVEEASASDIESDEELPQHALQRRGSDSSIGDFEDETTKAAHSDSESEGEDAKDAKAALLNSVADATMVVDEASDVEVEEVEVEEMEEGEQSDVEELPQPSQPVEVVEPFDDLESIVTDEPAHEAMDVDETVLEPEVEATPKRVAATDHSSPATDKRASRGFNNLIPNSPVLEEFPGDIALREAIEEDAPVNRDASPTPEPESDDLHATQVDVMQIESLQPSQVEPQPENEEEPEPEPVKPAPKRRGRPPKNPPSSPLKVPASQPTPSRSLRAASREPAPLPASQPETRGGRVTRSRGALASSAAQPPAPPATRRRTRAASKEPPATPATTRRTRAASVEAAAAAAEAAVPASQPQTQPIIEESEDEFHHAEETPRANNNLSSPVLRNTRNVRSAVASSQVDELDSSYPVKTQLSPFTQKSPLPPSSMPNGHAHEIEVPDSATQSSPLLHRRRPVEETPLFMSEGSQTRATQAYNAFPAPLIPETQIPETQDLQSSVAGSSVTGSSVRGSKGKHTNGQSNGGGLAPPIDDDDDASATSIVNGGGTYASDSDDDTATTTSRMFPPIPLSLPRRSTAAPLSSSFPTLSALPKDLLRSGKSVGTSVWNAVTGSGSRTTGVLPSQQRDDEDSDEESGSGTDSEEEVPESRKGRYAGGARRKSRLSKTGGAMSGW